VPLVNLDAPLTENFRNPCGVFCQPNRLLLIQGLEDVFFSSGEARALRHKICPIRDALDLKNLRWTLSFKVSKSHRLRHWVKAWLSNVDNTLGHSGNLLQSAYDVLLFFLLSDLHVVCCFLHFRFLEPRL